MPRDLTVFLWLLKLGALANLYFLANAIALPAGESDPHIVIPALIFFAVSGYRCLFPNRYEDNVVLHSTVLSSTLVTRVLATFSEVAYIYQFAHVIRLLNVSHVGWVDALAWLMVIQVVVSQFFVWGAILTGRLTLYVYEELGWAVIFLANTGASAYLYLAQDALGDAALLLQLNLLFGLVYLPWQLMHLRALRANARTRQADTDEIEPITRSVVARHLHRALHERNRSTDAKSWGGLIGLTWMTAYWAAMIPLWVHQVVLVTGVR